jgi:hypothetical protein
MEGATGRVGDSEFTWASDYGHEVDSYYKTPSYWT